MLTSPVSDASPPHCSSLQIMLEPLNPQSYEILSTTHPKSSSSSWCAHLPPPRKRQRHPNPAMQTQSTSGLPPAPDTVTLRLALPWPTTEACYFSFSYAFHTTPFFQNIQECYSDQLSNWSDLSLHMQVIIWNSSLFQTDRLIQAAGTGSSVTLYNTWHTPSRNLLAREIRFKFTNISNFPDMLSEELLFFPWPCFGEL